MVPVTCELYEKKSGSFWPAGDPNEGASQFEFIKNGVPVSFFIIY